MQPIPLQKTSDLQIPFYDSLLSAGFPSPADDFMENKIDLNDKLISHPNSTFLVRVEGQSMVNAGISTGDVVIVDKSLEAKDGQIVVAVLEGDFTLKRLHMKDEQITLRPENPSYPEIKITEDTNFEIWGVVTWIIKKT